MITLLALLAPPALAQESAPAPEQPEADDPAAPSEEASREADLFGAPAAEAPPEVPPEAPAVAADAPADQDSAALGGGLMGADAVSGRLDRADERLTLGGQLTLRFQASIPEDAEVADLSASSPNLLDLFLDVRPSDRLRAYASGRLTYDWTVKDGALSDYGQELSATTAALDQIWIKGDLGQRLYITAGQQRIKWGAGRFWNPTDFLNQQILDPLAVYDLRTGVPLVKLHLPIGYAVNLYAVASLDGASELRDTGGALRGEFAFGQSELTVSAAARRGQPLRLGADLSTGVWLLDLHVEGAVQHGLETPFWEGALDYGDLSFPTEVDRSEDWIPQIVAGAEISFKIGDEDTLSLGAEGFYNDAGYPDASLYPWLLANGQFQPFYLGRAYVGAYAYLPSPGRWDHSSFTLSYLQNLSDQSDLLRLNVGQNVLSFLDLTAYVSYAFGAVGELHYGLEVPPIAFVEGLEDGLSVPPPMLDLGLWGRVRF